MNTPRRKSKPLDERRVAARAARRTQRWLSALAWMLGCWLYAERADAARVLAIVSDHSAPQLVPGAERFLSRHGEHQLVLRSVSQVAELSASALEEEWRAADAVLLLALFGDHVPRLVALTERSRDDVATVVALASDLRLTRRSRIAGEAAFAGLGDDAIEALTKQLGSAVDVQRERAALSRRFPRAARWLAARAYWLGRGEQNVSSLFGWAAAQVDSRVVVNDPVPPRDFVFQDARGADRAGGAAETPADGQPVVALLAYQDTSSELLEQLCRAIERYAACVRVLARWGQASVAALAELPSRVRPGRLSSIVMLQDFVIGGGDGQREARRHLARSGVPVINAMVQDDRTQAEWRSSEDGLAHDKVHYRIAMPELQGASQPLVVASRGPEQLHAATGLRYAVASPIGDEIAALARKLERWNTLQTKPVANKRVAIVYYNHPPGRHNIGADNLDVPESLLEILRLLQGAGYDLGSRLPSDSAALLDVLQQRGVNLPDNGAALKELAARVPSVGPEQYANWFQAQAPSLRRHVVGGPLATIPELLRAPADTAAVRGLVKRRVQHLLEDVTHLLQGVEHPARQRALELARQVQEIAAALADEVSAQQRAAQLQALEERVAALQRTGIEGLRGWGPPPGRVMVDAGRLVVPGAEFGNVFIGPQPPRGWEVDEELLHANLAFAPPHQYLAYYYYLKEIWRADVVVHLGRHSTYEFLPGHRVGLTSEDAPRVIIGDLPSVYVYIVDGVGEGIQAKRRGQAVIVDHLTPSLSTTPLYDRLLELRQLVESYEASSDKEAHQRKAAVVSARKLVRELDLERELRASMQHELDVRGVDFEHIDDELLMHEVGHYLTDLQERFMPFGLHVFGRSWSRPAVERMLTSMAEGEAIEPEWRAALVRSPEAEAAALLAGLNGEYIEPGPGNDPIRTPAALPTGRNFHALDSSVLPTRLAARIGAELARSAAGLPAEGSDEARQAEAVVLWASDTVRDEGAMVAYGLERLGVVPKWNSRGIVKGLARAELTDERPRRVDCSFVTSGLFRDLYGNLLVLLDRAALLALDGASLTIEAEHPRLKPALEAALERLGEQRSRGDESLERNFVAAHWVADASEALDAGASAEQAGRAASFRVFGNAPGGYGAGINRLAERSGSWTERSQLAKAYIHRMGHAYGHGVDGAPAHDSFRRRLAVTDTTALGRSSNLYGLLDNNDAFDYLGGLGLAVEALRGAPPSAFVADLTDEERSALSPLSRTLLLELRGRHLNPKYLEALMEHGYAGARTMGSEFFENLWGWQVTSPHLIDQWVWDEAKRVYLDDGHEIGIDEFLEDAHNAHVKTNVVAIFLVAAHKGFWKASDDTLRELAELFARLVAEHGLPGSGHTDPNHPVMQFVTERLTPDAAEQLQQTLDDARIAHSEQLDPSIVAELETAARRSPGIAAGLGLALGALLIFGVGVLRGRQGGTA